MSKSIKQAGKLFLWLFILSFAAGAVSAKTQDSGAVEGNQDDVPLIEDIWGNVTGLFGAKPSDQQEEEEEEGTEPQAFKPDEKLIHAKRLDDKSKKEDEGKPISLLPYKVYQAPIIKEEQPARKAPASYHNSADDQGSFSGWAAKSPTVDLNRPIPLPAPQGAGEKKEPPRLVPPVSALPKQFFPIFPRGADPDTVAQFLPVASNVALESDHSDVTRAVIFIHDMTRNAAEGVATLMTLGGSNGREMLILAPQFPLDVDVLRFADHLPDRGKNIVSWPLEKGWNEGGLSLARSGSRGISSFTAIDVLSLFLADRRRFPKIKEVVLVGHGMGADFVQRYAAVGQAPDLLTRDRVAIRFVLANPSSYLYFTNLRPSEDSLAFSIVKEVVCKGVNYFPYGLDDLTPYARRTGGDALRLRYPERQVFYFAGDQIINDAFLDSSCAAVAQGKDRLSRTQAYQRHIAQSFGQAADGQTFKIIKNAGYDPVSIFGSSCGLTAIFGDGMCR